MYTTKQLFKFIFNCQVYFFFLTPFTVKGLNMTALNIKT